MFLVWCNLICVTVVDVADFCWCTFSFSISIVHKNYMVHAFFFHSFFTANFFPLFCIFSIYFMLFFALVASPLPSNWEFELHKIKHKTCMYTVCRHKCKVAQKCYEAIYIPNAQNMVFCVQDVYKHCVPALTEFLRRFIFKIIQNATNYTHMHTGEKNEYNSLKKLLILNKHLE